MAVVYKPTDTRMSEFSEVLSKLDMCLSKLPSPTPTIAVMGDMNFPKQSLALSRSDGDTSVDLVPLIAAHRDGETVGGKQDRLQAAKLYDLEKKKTACCSKLTSQPMGLRYWT